MGFEAWLAKLLGHGEGEVKHLLADETALHFLMAWSLFESKLFGGFVKLNNIDAFCKRIVVQEQFNVGAIESIAAHFHGRYQDNALYRHLMHQQTSTRMEGLLKQPFASLSDDDKVFVAALTAYRYRNNIFHGNKGVDSWLQFRPQIKHCIDAMKAFVDHAEQRVPTLKTPAAA